MKIEHIYDAIEVSFTIFLGFVIAIAFFDAQVENDAALVKAYFAFLAIAIICKVIEVVASWATDSLLDRITKKGRVHE